MSALVTDEYQIDACLARHAASIREFSPSSWEFSLPGTATGRGTARVDLDWLLLDIPLGRARPNPSSRRLQDVLSLAARINGPAKFGFDPLTGRIHLQAEIPLVLEDDPMERIDLAFVSFEQALAECDSPGSTSKSEPKKVSLTLNVPAVIPDLAERCARWKQLCEEATWPLHERTSSKLAVSLDVPGSFCQALVEAHGPDTMRIRHEAGRLAVGEASRHALAAFLLAGARSVRMARAYLEIESAGPEVSGAEPVFGFGWEIVLRDPPAQFELERALSALSMACRSSTNELAVLTNDEVAKRYLAVQGMVS